jgi:hypothetical protein
MYEGISIRYVIARNEAIQKTMPKGWIASLRLAMTAICLSNITAPQEGNYSKVK